MKSILDSIGQMFMEYIFEHLIDKLMDTFFSVFNLKGKTADKQLKYCIHQSLKKLDKKYKFGYGYDKKERFFKELAQKKQDISRESFVGICQSVLYSDFDEEIWHEWNDLIRQVIDEKKLKKAKGYILIHPNLCDCLEIIIFLLQKDDSEQVSPERKKDRRVRVCLIIAIPIIVIGIIYSCVIKKNEQPILPSNTSSILNSPMSEGQKQTEGAGERQPKVIIERSTTDYNPDGSPKSKTEEKYTVY